MNLFQTKSAVVKACQRVASYVMPIVVLSVVAVTAAHAQLDRGTVTGSVRDAKGSVVAHASVTVRNLDTGVTAKVETNDDGTYQVLALNPGTRESPARRACAARRTNPGTLHFQAW